MLNKIKIELTFSLSSGKKIIYAPRLIKHMLGDSTGKKNGEKNMITSKQKRLESIQ